MAEPSESEKDRLVQWRGVLLGLAGALIAALIAAGTAYYTTQLQTSNQALQSREDFLRGQRQQIHSRGRARAVPMKDGPIVGRMRHEDRTQVDGSGPGTGRRRSSEIGVCDAGVAGNDRGRTFSDHHPALHHVDKARQLGSEPDVLLDDEDSRSIRA